MILQPRILEWVAVSYARGSSQPRIKPASPALQVDSLPTEPPGKPTLYIRTSLVAEMIKNQPEMWDTFFRSLGWEDPLEEGLATHSSILAWRIPWTEKLDGLQSMGTQRVGHD